MEHFQMVSAQVPGSRRRGSISASSATRRQRGTTSRARVITNAISAVPAMRAAFGVSIMSRANGMMQTDVEAIEALLNHRLGGRVRSLRVESLAQGLILTGCTSSYHAKQLAQNMILEELGLPLLANQIAVHPTPHV
jgi:hypothetical protein